MKNNDLDQFYTNPKVVDSLLDKLFGLFYSLQLDPNQYQFIEPSAGTGNFIDGLYKKGVNIENNVLAYDLDPKNNKYIIKKDFLNIDLKHKTKNIKKTITIGNPPFGKKGLLALEFLNKSLEHSGIVAFILPNTFKRYSLQSKVNEKAKLIYDIPLKPNSFIVGDREYNVNCCFQIWTRPEIIVSTSDLRLKQQIKSLNNDIELFIHNNTKETLKYFDKLKYKWDFAIHRQGYYDYNVKISNPNELSKNKQYLFIKCNNKKIMKYINKIDFNKLARKNNTTTLGFSNSDFFEELYTLILNYERNTNFFN